MMESLLPSNFEFKTKVWMVRSTDTCKGAALTGRETA